MSWAKDEWKEGLTAQALRKISEYEESLERNSKELQQRQFQLDSLNAALQKQKLITEEQKNIANQFKRDLQSASEKCDEYEKTCEKIMADIRVKDSRINCLDGQLLKEKQALECEIAKCNHLKTDLETNTTKYNKLLSKFNKLQKEAEVQHRKANYYEDCDKKISCPTFSNSKLVQEVSSIFKETSGQAVQQAVKAIPFKNVTCSSTTAEEMDKPFQMQESVIRELQRALENVRKEKDIITEKWQKSVQQLDACQSKLVDMENKQKRLVQQMECSQHNVEAGRRHQEERMKEKEREYRNEIASQNEALSHLEHQLKEVKIKLDQEQKCSSVRLKEFEMTNKKLQREIAMAHEVMDRLEFEKNEQNSLVESHENTIVELRKELAELNKSKYLVAKSQEENVRTIQSLNELLERQSSELEEKKAMVIKLEKSKELVITKERQKYLELLRSQEGGHYEGTKNLRNELAKEKGKPDKTTKVVQEKDIIISALNTVKEALEFGFEQLKLEDGKIGEQLEMIKQQFNVHVDRLALTDKWASDYQIHESVIEDLKKRLKTKDEELNQIKVQNDLVITENFKKIDDLKQILDSKDSLLDQLKMLAETQSKDLRAAKEESKKQEEKREKDTTELELELDKLRNDVKQKCKELEHALERNESPQCELENKIAAVQLTERDTEKEREQLLKQTETAAKDIKEIDIEQLSKQKDDELFVVTKELENKISEVERVRKDYEASQVVQLELRHQLGIVMQELEKYKCEQDRSGELMKANEKIKELEETFLAKSSKLEEEREEIVAKTKEFVLQREKEHVEKAVNLERELAKKEQILMNNCEELLQMKHQLETEQKSKDSLLRDIEEREKEIDLEKEAMEKGSLTPRRFKAMEADLKEERKLTKSLQEKCVVLEEVIQKEQANCFALQKRVKLLQGELPGLEEKEARINALESEVEMVSKQFGSVKDDLEAEKMNSVILEKQVEQLKQRELNLEKSLQDEVQTNEILRRDYEQLRQKENNHDSEQSETMPVTIQQPDSMKVSELECCICGLKTEIKLLQDKISYGEDSLKRVSESKDVLERSLNEKLKENEELREILKVKLKLIESLEERIAALEQNLAKTEKNNEWNTLTLNSELKSLKESGTAQLTVINELEEKRNQLELLPHRNTASLTLNGKTQTEVEEDLANMKQLVSKQTSSINELKVELQQMKCSLKISNDNLEEEKRKTEFMETMKKEALKLKEDCASWRGRCTDYENKLSEEQLDFEKERKILEEKISSITNCYNEVKSKLAHLEEENKPMVERLLQLEGEMIMMPRIESLQKELNELRKELEEEKESAIKYEKLSREYLNKLNEFRSTSSSTSVGEMRRVSEDQKMYDEVIANSQLNERELKDHQNRERLTISPLRKEQKVKEEQSGETITVTPLLEEERQVCLSPITSYLSNLGFSSPTEEKMDSKNPSHSIKPAEKSKIPKPKMTIAANPPADKKRKDEEATQSKSKRVKLEGTKSNLHGIRSPFVLHRKREIQTRSKTSSLQSRLGEPHVRNRGKAHSRIPKPPTAAASNIPGGKGSSQFPTSQPSSDQCKMQ